MDLLFRGLTDVDTTAARRVVADVPDAFPCRRCLTDLEPGEAALLVSHDPFPVGADSAYRGPSPVFVHERDCAPAAVSEVPEQQRRRLLSVRSFDGSAVMIDAEVVHGSALEDVLQRMLEEPGSSYVHVHNAGPGCFAVRVERADRG